MAPDALSTPPPPGRARNITYPEIPSAQLSNGLTVAVVEDRRLPRVTVRLGVPAGRAANPQENRARLPLAVEMTQEGTGQRTSRQLAEDLDRIAAQLHSEVYMEHTVFALTVLEAHLETALGVFSEILLEPSFPADELEKLRSRWKSTVISQRTQPGFLSRERTFLTFYGGHPYSRVSVTQEEIDEVSRQQVQNSWDRYFGPSRALLIFSGPLKLARAVELAERHLGEWESALRADAELPSLPAVSGRLVRIVHRPHSLQSRILVAGRTPSRRDPELLRFRLANQVYGGSSSSRIFLNLREDKGFTYGAYSVLRTYGEDGLYMAAADVGNPVTRRALDEIFREMEAVRAGPPAEEALSVARWEIIGEFLRQMQTPAAIGLLELNRRLQDLPEDHYSSMIPKLERMTAPQVLDISRQYFDPANVVITAVGDREQIEPMLADLGEVKVYDADGKSL